jgi:phospholipid transport system substrate-binding protein
MSGARALRAASVVFAACQSLAWAAAGPVEVVQKLNSGLEDVLREAAQLSYGDRYERLSPILTEAFDFDLMAQQAIGQPWNELSPADQRRWVEAFRDLTAATYAARFNRYTGQRFETIGPEEQAAHDTSIVRSRVVDPAAENVDLTYRLRQNGGEWKVIDVYLKGSVSEVALRRSEYSSVLKRDGFEGLLAAVSRKITELAASPTPA